MLANAEYQDKKKKLLPEENASAALGQGVRKVVDTVSGALSSASNLTRDRNPPVNIYEEGSATEKVQRNMGVPGAGALGTAVDAATLIPRAVGRVSDNAYRGFTGQPANDSKFVMNPATKKLMPQSDDISSAAPLITSPIGPIKTDPIIGPNKPPDAGVTPAPGMIPSHVPFAASPAPSANQSLSAIPQKQVVPTAVGTEGGNISVNLSPNDRAIKGSLAAIDQAMASGKVLSPSEAERLANVRRQAGFLRGGTDRVPVGSDGMPLQQTAPQGSLASAAGNMDVAFDSSVTPEQKAAFLADPARPNAWIDKYNAKYLANTGGMTQGQRASRNTNKILAGSPGEINTFGDIMREKRLMKLADIDRRNSELGLAEQKLSADVANNQENRNLQRLGIVSTMRNQDATALREDRRNTLEDRKLTVAEAQQAARDKREEQRFQTTDQRAADANRLAQAKLLGDTEGGEAGLASTYNPRTPPPGPQASQVEQSAFGAWTRHNSANIAADIDKGETPQKIYDKYFSNVTPENQVALIGMLPAEIRQSIATMARERYTKK